MAFLKEKHPVCHETTALHAAYQHWPHCGSTAWVGTELTAALVLSPEMTNYGKPDQWLSILFIFVCRKHLTRKIPIKTTWIIWFWLLSENPWTWAQQLTYLLNIITLPQRSSVPMVIYQPVIKWNKRSAHKRRKRAKKDCRQRWTGFGNMTVGWWLASIVYRSCDVAEEFKSSKEPGQPF